MAGEVGGQPLPQPADHAIAQGRGMGRSRRLQRGTRAGDGKGLCLTAAVTPCRMRCVFPRILQQHLQQRSRKHASPTGSPHQTNQHRACGAAAQHTQSCMRLQGRLTLQGPMHASTFLALLHVHARPDPPCMGLCKTLLQDPSHTCTSTDCCCAMGTSTSPMTRSSAFPPLLDAGTASLVLARIRLPCLSRQAKSPSSTRPDTSVTWRGSKRARRCKCARSVGEVA